MLYDSFREGHRPTLLSRLKWISLTTRGLTRARLTDVRARARICLTGFAHRVLDNRVLYCISNGMLD